MENAAPADLGQSRPEPTWFIERGDGFIFACDERQAWDTFHNRSNWMRRDFKKVGTSDGTRYFAIMAEGKARFAALLTDIQELKSNYNRYLKAEDKFRFEELLGDEDEKVQRAVKLRTETQQKLDEKEAQLADFNRNLVKEAEQAELDIARANGWKEPRNMDIHCNDNDRAKIQANLAL